MDSGGLTKRNLTQPLPWADLARFVKSERIPDLGGPACVQVCLRNASRQISWVVSNKAKFPALLLLKHIYRLLFLRGHFDLFPVCVFKSQCLASDTLCNV